MMFPNVILFICCFICHQHTVTGITKISFPDHEDPNYTDVCYSITREMCDFCCLVDFEFCSRDIGICEPVTDRHIDIIVHCAYVFAGVLVGFPIIINCFKCITSFRCCKSLFPTTSGITCYSCVMRCVYISICINFTQHFHITDEERMQMELNDPLRERGMAFKIFYYTFCCFLCPCLFRKKK